MTDSTKKILSTGAECISRAIAGWIVIEGAITAYRLHTFNKGLGQALKTEVDLKEQKESEEEKNDS